LRLKYLAVGCPVARREWVIDRWFDHIEVACGYGGVEPIYVFVGDNEHDPTFDRIRERAPQATVMHVPLKPKDGHRDWSLPHRYGQMVELRNLLLRAVRVIGPQAFLSIDSDILAHPSLVDVLVHDLEEDNWAAVGGKCYMTPADTIAPSWANLTGAGGLHRVESPGYFKVDAIMAIKLMAPSAYHVDYRHHPQGEDIGWSLACRQHALTLAWDGSVVSKHVMEPHMLDRVDPRVGF
jgi:hypothetical protein